MTVGRNCLGGREVVTHGKGDNLIFLVFSVGVGSCFLFWATIVRLERDDWDCVVSMSLMVGLGGSFSSSSKGQVLGPLRLRLAQGENGLQIGLGPHEGPDGLLERDVPTLKRIKASDRQELGSVFEMGCEVRAW